MKEYIGRTLQGHGKLLLSDAPLGRGGEGAVYAVHNHAVPGLPEASRIVAKIYHEADDTERKMKTAAMLKNPPQSDSVAWPLGIVFTPDKQFAGYVMVKLDNSKYRQWSELANAADRRETSPHFDVQYALTAAKNLAIAIESIHQAGHRVGDVNESNIFVGADATVLIVDTDSAQIANGDTVYRCLVGKPDYTAPELIGGSLRDKDRTRATDVFAYAVAIYQMMTGGFHPTDGVYQGDDMPPDFAKKIAMNSYPSLFGPNQAFKQNPKIPADALPLALRNAIMDALDPNPSNRPSLSTFVEVLDSTTASLTQCDKESNHWYTKELSHCPWCAHAAQVQLDPWSVQPVATAPAASQTALPPLSFEEQAAPVKARRAPIQRQGQRPPQPQQSPQQAPQGHHAPQSAPYQQYPGQHSGQPYGASHSHPGASQGGAPYQQQLQQQQQAPPARPNIPKKIKGKTVLQYADGTWGVRPKISTLLRHNPKVGIHCIKNETPGLLRFWWSTDKNLPSPIGLFLGAILHVILSVFWISLFEMSYTAFVTNGDWDIPEVISDVIAPWVALISVGTSALVVVIMMISGIIQLVKARKQGGGSISMFAKDSLIATIFRYTPITIFYGLPFVVFGGIGLLLWALTMLIQAIPTPRSMQ